MVIIQEIYCLTISLSRRLDIPDSQDTSDPPLDGLTGRVAELRLRLQSSDPAQLSDRCAVEYLPLDAVQSRGEFRLEIWGRPTRVSYPEMVAWDALNDQELPTYLQAMLLYYFATCDGTPASGQWIAFSELPDGRFYTQAFQGYTGVPLAQAFGEDLMAFSQAAEACLGERRYAFGDIAYAFQALPRVALLVVFWQGDEDFSSTCQVLFDSSVSHFLPTDACAILGSHIARQLIKAARAGQVIHEGHEDH